MGKHMHLDFTPEQRELQAELRAYFADLIDAETQASLQAEGNRGPTHKRLVRQMASDGWLAVAWPKEYGGKGLSAFEQYVFYDEVSRAHAPYNIITMLTVGPTIMKFGTEDQKQRFLPRIAAGEIDFSIGYSEPEAGSDLASLKTRAVRDGDHYVINGSKLFTSGGDRADYIWLAARTDPDVPKHRGISLFILDTKSPGYSATVIRTVGAHNTAATYYDNVLVPAEDLVGGVENQGWTLITNQLNHERVAMAAFSVAAIRVAAEVQQWARDTKLANGECVIDLPWAQMALARVHARLEAMKLLNWKMAADVGDGTLTPANASAAKIYSTETCIECYRLMLDVMEQPGYLRGDSRGSVVQGQVEQLYRTAVVNTFGGGNNEVLREIVARMGLGLPRVRHT